MLPIIIIFTLNLNYVPIFCFLQEKDVAKQPLWNVLRNDFTKGSKLKDWDKTDPTTVADTTASSSDSEIEDTHT